MRFWTRSALTVAGGLLLVASTAAGQSTGTPSYQAPERAFVRSEFGGIVSFPDPTGTAFEGAYRVSSGRMDAAVRGGFFDGAGPGSTVLAGVEARMHALSHTPDFPLDGAFIFGAGGWFAEGQSRFHVPAGLSLGRRIGVDGSRVSVTPYAQPTAFLRGGNNVDTDLIFAMGLGTDLRLSSTLDMRLNMSVGDIEGVSIGAVWLH